LRSEKRTFIGPLGVSATHSPSTRRSDPASPDAHLGKFSGTDRKSYACSALRAIETLRVRP